MRRDGKKNGERKSKLCTYTEETSRVGRKMSGELAEPILIGEHKRIPKFDNPNLEVLKVYLCMIILFIPWHAMATECVALLHGLGRTSASMSKMAQYLSEYGYSTIMVNYPSRKFHIHDLTEQFVLPQISYAMSGKTCDKLHLVGYSMGGIVSRYIIAYHKPKNFGRAVLIASPNQGSELVKKISTYFWFDSIFGPGAEDLMIDSEFMSILPDASTYEAGVISGNLTMNPLTSLFVLNGPDDGTVSVNSTMINGMKDHIVIPATHHTIVNDYRTLQQTERFITTGKFDRN
jgi:pimeloyl-ACP methyl ester carboxylesterase